MHTRRDALKSASAALLAGPAFRPSRPIRVGQIGLGHAHAGKLSVFRASPAYEVVGLAEPDESLWGRFADQPAFRGVPRMGVRELLDRPGLELVLVETRVPELLGTARTAVDAGKHVHMDKPAGDSLPTLRRLLDDASSHNLHVFMGYMFRYNPGIVLARDLLARGWLGELFAVEGAIGKVVEAADRGPLARFPGGILFELGCHLIDLVVGLLGRPDSVSGHRRATRADSLVDNAVAVLEYPRALATVSSSALEVEGFARRHLTLLGTEGTLTIEPIDQPAGRLALSQPRGDHRRGCQTIELPRYDRYVADADDIARVLRGEKAPDWTPDHDLWVQEAVLLASGMPTDR